MGEVINFPLNNIQGESRIEKILANCTDYIIIAADDNGDICTVTNITDLNDILDLMDISQEDVAAEFNVMGDT